jgi:23S rRNA-/tRNA-specific pseudouridylate synthase
LEIGDHVRVHIQTSWPDHIEGIEVVFEDDHVAVVNKPPGLLTNSHKKPSLATMANSFLTPSPEADVLLLPVTLHRLDKDTSGLVIFCKTKVAVHSIAEQFESRSIAKFYSAIAEGHVPSPQSISIDLDGKDALTEVIDSRISNENSVLVIRLHTGRKNQIRRHLSALGHPIVGDRRYEASATEQPLHLCATKIEFVHPVKFNTITVEIEPPFPV